METKYNKINLICETKSNLFIGGMNETFEIGGIDMYTVTRDNKPYIPGSSLKGVFRNMFRIVYSDCELLKSILTEYFNKEIEKITEIISSIEKNSENIKTIEKLERTKQIMEDYKNNIKGENIFGVSGLNSHPRLIFSDFDVLENTNKDYFSIDTKNKIEYSENEVISNPRIYKTVRKGIKFEGSISLRSIPQDFREELYNIIVKSLENFNNGNYRIGNSQSRGYGLVEFTMKVSG